MDEVVIRERLIGSGYRGHKPRREDLVYVGDRKREFSCPNLVERSADWMDQARVDLAHARHDLEAGYFEWACFSAQQSAEKAVKAVFQKIGAEAWGHSVSDLLEVLADRFEVTDELMDAALELDKSYIPTRYPDAHPSGSPGSRYTKGEAQRLIDHADDILRFCEGILSRA